MKKQRIISIALIAIFLIAISYTFWNNWKENKTMVEVFGTKLVPEEELLQYNTINDIFGDGFSIEVIKLSEKNRNYFTNLPANFFTSYPTNKIDKKNYTLQKWEKTPLKKEYDVLGEVATLKLPESWAKRISAKKNNEIEKFLEYTNQILSEEGNYYAMNYAGNINTEHIDGIDLYVVNPEAGIVVKINRQ